MDDSWVSDLSVSDESIGLIVRRLSIECHDFAAARDIKHLSVEDHLGLVCDVLRRNLNDLILFRPVVTTGASGLSLWISFDPVCYRRLAEAAKNRVTGF